MRSAELLEDGKIRIPVRITDGDIIGDSFEDIGPDDRRFKEWKDFLKATGKFKKPKIK